MVKNKNNIRGIFKYQGISNCVFSFFAPEITRINNNMLYKICRMSTQGDKVHIQGGYKSFFKNIIRIGNIIEILDESKKVNIIDIIRLNIINNLEEGKIYRMLLSVKYVSDGNVRGGSPSCGIMINNNINVELLLERIIRELLKYESEYNLENYSGECFIGFKEWISEEEFQKIKNKNKDEDILNEVLLDDIKNNNQIKEINSRIINGDIFKDINLMFPNFNSYNKLLLLEENNIEDLNYKEFKDSIIEYISEFNNNVNIVKFEKRYIKFKIKNVYYFKFNSEYELLFVYESLEGDDEFNLIRINCLCDFKSWEIVKLAWNKGEYPYSRWIDTFINKDYYKRIINEYVLHMDGKGKIKYLEKEYRFPEIRIGYKDKIKEKRFGSIDLETMFVNSDIKVDKIIDIDTVEESIEFSSDVIDTDYKNRQILEVYAGGWKLNMLDSNGTSEEYMRMFFLGDNNINSSNDLIKVMFEELFKLNVDGYTIFAHNLGRFDAIFLIKELCKLRFKVRGLWKDNAILKIKIMDPETKQSITLLDSINFVPFSLKKILTKFNCNVVKGNFPHLFVNKDNLNYKGVTPDIKYFMDINVNDYKLIQSNKWNLRNECLKYLGSDIEGLLEIVNLLSDYYFNNYQINISKYMTLSSLSLVIFGSSFFDNENYSIKMIKGPIEKYIRSAYFGGNVGSFNNDLIKLNGGIITKAKHYDMNSQYPNAMLNIMPVGNPVFSTNKNLDYYSGFVYAKIIPPTEDRLKNLYLQNRDNMGRIICPRNSFVRWIDTIELASSLVDGYKYEIICGINFPDSKLTDSSNLFRKFVEHFYKKKNKAKDDVERVIAKLTLNSLYGKFGQKEIESRIKIVSREEADIIKRKYNYTYLSEITDNLVLIKYSSKLNDKLRRLYEEDTESEFNELRNFISKDRGINSAVQISCRISALARVSINKFKNLKDNPLYYSDTDSLIIQHELAENIIGKDLGKWKLEGDIKKGVIIRSKLYMYENTEGDLKKVAAGINANDLTFEDYIDLYNGKDITVYKDKLNIKWEMLNIFKLTQKIKLKGITKNS